MSPRILVAVSCLVAVMAWSILAAAGGGSAVVVDTSRISQAVPVMAGASGNNQLLYFTSPSVVADGTQIVYISDRTGAPNLFVRDLRSGGDRQLSFNKEGYLKSYVYFDGLPYKGFGKASVSLDPRNKVVYYIQGRQIRSVTLDGKERILAELPRDQMTAFTHVSADGTRLCVPTTDARALDGEKKLGGKPEYDIDGRVQKENLSSYLHVYDTTTGREIVNERVPRAWITHVQFSPKDRNLILYNNEWPSDCGVRRIWLWDGKEHRAMRTEGEGRSRADWVSHEMWERDGSAIIYHGKHAKGPTFIGRVKTDGSGTVELPLPAGWRRYGHFTSGNSGQMVSDGYYEQTDDGEPKKAGAWISLLKVDWISRRITWYPLCRNYSNWDSQDSHPHPILDEAGSSIYFTSNKSGKRDIYTVRVPSQ